MKNDQVHPELVRLFVALENALGDACVQLSELINIDIIERAKATKAGIEINSEF